MTAQTVLRKASDGVIRAVHLEHLIAVAADACCRQRITLVALIAGDDAVYPSQRKLIVAFARGRLPRRHRMAAFTVGRKARYGVIWIFRSLAICVVAANAGRRQRIAIVAALAGRLAVPTL